MLRRRVFFQWQALFSEIHLPIASFKTKCFTIFRTIKVFVCIGETSYSGNYSSSGWTIPDTNWGATGAIQNQGRWTVRGNKNKGNLILNYFNGRQEVIDYKIHYARGRIWNSQYCFNGIYYFRKEAYNKRE